MHQAGRLTCGEISAGTATEQLVLGLVDVIDGGDGLVLVADRSDRSDQD
jgi:hypothetical protein